MFAADAVARLSGTIGVAAVTAGPGVTNTITAVKNAQLAESPILLIGMWHLVFFESLHRVPASVHFQMEIVCVV